MPLDMLLVVFTRVSVKCTVPGTVRYKVTSISIVLEVLELNSRLPRSIARYLVAAAPRKLDVEVPELFQSPVRI